MLLAISLPIFVVSLVAFRFAMPVNGQVRPYLRNDDVQAYYAVVLVLGLVFGLLGSIFSLAQLT